MIRVLIADDEPLIRSGIAMLLSAEADICVLGEAGDGHEALALARRLQPDVVLMDVRMPHMDGIEATRQIVPTHGPSPGSPAVVVLTSFRVDSAAYEALQAGAVGFVIKDSAPLELVMAVRAAHGGGGWLDPLITRTLIRDFAEVAHREVRIDRLRELTGREREVLEHAAAGLSNAAIARMLFVSEGTVKSHLTHVYAKLGVSNRTQAILRLLEV